LVIVASGLWFRRRFVWYMTVLSLLSYGILVAKLYIVLGSAQLQHDQMVSKGIDIDPAFEQLLQKLTAFSGIDRHVIFAIALIVLGSIVSYLVERVRVLSNFYGRPL
jgi:hypothetical protein